MFKWTGDYDGLWGAGWMITIHFLLSCRFLCVPGLIFGVRPRNHTFKAFFSTLQFTSCHLNKRICLARWKCGCLVKFRHVLRRWCSHLHIRIWTQPLLLQSLFPLHLWLLSSGVPHQHLSKRKIISIVRKGIVDPFQKELGKKSDFKNWLTFNLS